VVLEGADLPGLELLDAEIQQDGFLNPAVDLPVAVGWFGETELTAVEAGDDRSDGGAVGGGFKE